MRFLNKKSVLNTSSEHAGKSCRAGVPLARPSMSTMRDHNDGCHQNIDLDKFTIIGRCSYSSTHIGILESLFIYKLKPNLNNTVSSFPFSIVQDHSYALLSCICVHLVLSCKFVHLCVLLQQCIVFFLSLRVNLHILST